MTQREFEERTRRLITAEDYYLVENLYMAAGNMGKDGMPVQRMPNLTS